MTTVQMSPAPVGCTGVGEFARSAAEHREYGERHGTLHPRVWAALEQSVLPRVALPAHCGGLEWQVPQILDVVHRLGAGGGPVEQCGAGNGVLLAGRGHQHGQEKAERLGDDAQPSVDGLLARVSAQAGRLATSRQARPIGAVRAQLNVPQSR